MDQFFGLGEKQLVNTGLLLRAKLGNKVIRKISRYPCFSAWYSLYIYNIPIVKRKKCEWFILAKFPKEKKSKFNVRYKY